MKRKGFTLVEIVVVLSLIFLLVSLLIYLYLNSSFATDQDTKSNDYYRMYSMLEAKIKRDLRSSSRIVKMAEGIWELTVVEMHSGHPVQKKIVYWADEDGHGVTRHSPDGKEEIFDFSAVLEGQKFQFQIQN